MEIEWQDKRTSLGELTFFENYKEKKGGGIQNLRSLGKIMSGYNILKWIKGIVILKYSFCESALEEIGIKIDK